MPSRYGTAQPQPVWEQVLDEIRRQIVLGELAPGERLVETTLAHRFGISRGPIRTALLTLEQSGLVRSSDRRGVEVTDFSTTDIAELYAVRGALEVLAVRVVAERPPPELVERLQGHIDRQTAFRGQGLAVESAEADLAFHEEICASCGNHLLLVTWTNLADSLAVIMTRMHRGDRTSAAGAGHSDILAAIDAADPDAAEHALRRHLYNASSGYQAARAAES